MRSIRTLAFLLASVPVAALALGVLIAGWTAVAVLAITPLGVPALVGFRAAVGGIARLEAAIANRLLGTNVRPPLRSPGPGGFWQAGFNVLRDDAFWRQQAYLLVRQTAGFAVAVGEWSLLAASLGSLTLPIWYRWSAPELGSWHVDTLGRSLLGVPAGMIGLVIAFLLLRVLAAGSRRLVVALLGAEQGAATTQTPEERRRALALHAAVYAVINLALALVWAVTSRGYFWPEWTLIAFGLPLAVEGWMELVPERIRRVPPQLVRRTGPVVALAIFFTLIWAVTSRGYFWPVWPILGLTVSLAAGAIREFTRRERRISQLEETRAGAVDQQESDLERIERDLHDGAQARLVALGMNLGMAEQKLATDPVAAQELLAEAQRGTREALEELRTLARGIHPPVLADRGLGAAIAALAARTPLEVNVAVDLSSRPPRTVETAAYFVAAEALANAGKHAAADRVEIGIHADGEGLVVEVVDDGRGGADPTGDGLRGLARRVEALDGTLAVESPAGGPTTIRAVMPCEW
ncbi:MAG: sensor domain-containing protein [Gaiellaceae bacterium]